MAYHARLSASGAKRWMNCPASVFLAETFGLTGYSIEAGDRGTHLHELAENAIKNKMARHDVLIADPTLSDEDLDTIMAYVDWASRLLAFGYDILELELQVEDESLPDWGGTLDFAAVGKDRICIADFKTGVWPVEAEGNPQLMSYAHGFLLHLEKLDYSVSDNMPLDIVVIQPRSMDNVFERRFEASVGAIRKWVDKELRPAVADVGSVVEPKPGDWCTFCPAMLMCPTKRDPFEEAHERTNLEVSEMTDDFLAEQLAKASAVEEYIKSVRNEALHRAKRGIGIPGYKLVMGVKRRVWRAHAEEKLQEAFGEDAFVRSLRSPAQVEKLAGGKEIAHKLSYKPEGAPKLVPHDAPGKEVNMGSQFENIS